MASTVDPFKKISVDVHAGGQLFWSPSPMYTGGLRHKFDNVLLNEISLFDKFDWFYDVTGERPGIVDAYYIMPMEEVETGLRKLEDDTSVREMIMTMKDQDTINIWLEKSHHPVTSFTPNRVESSRVVNISDRDTFLNHGDQVFIDVEALEELEYFSDAGGKLAEDFEDPADDDIFVERPDDVGWLFISDRQKGLLDAVEEVFGADTEHRYCLRHMYNNFKTKFRGLDMKQKFWEAASVANKNLFNKVMKEINDMYPAIDEDDVTPYVWLMRVEPKHWARSHFPTTSKCASIVNNMSESFNAYILSARGLPIISMWEWIRRKLMERLQVKVQGMSKYEGTVCPNILKKMRKDMDKHGKHCSTIYCGDQEYSVDCYKETYVVKLKEQTCTCGMYELQGYPCVHATSALDHHRLKWESYVSNFYKKDNYMATYAHIIHSVPSAKFYDESGMGLLQPPLVTIKVGRPQIERRKDQNDVDPTRVSRKGHTKTCSRCLGSGHNVLSCKQPFHPKSKLLLLQRTTNEGQSSAQTSQEQSQLNATGRKLPVWFRKVQQKPPAKTNVYVVPPQVNTTTAAISVPSVAADFHKKNQKTQAKELAKKIKDRNQGHFPF